MDLLDYLIKEHRDAESLLTKLAASTPGDERENVLAELTFALSVHMELEEEQVYPLVDAHLGEAAAEAAEAEHEGLRNALGECADMVGRTGFSATVTMLAAAVAHHVEQEENEVFPYLRDRADELRMLVDPESLEADAAEALAAD